MKTTLDLPRPLFLRIASRAARLRIPISRYVAESLAMNLSVEPPHPPRKKPTNATDPLFDSWREELGL